MILQPSEAPELHDNNPDYVNNNIYRLNSICLLHKRMAKKMNDEAICYKSSLFDLIKAAIKTMVTAMVKDIN